MRNEPQRAPYVRLVDGLMTGNSTERVVIRGGDTDRVGFGMGTIASRVAAVAGPGGSCSSTCCG